MAKPITPEQLAASGSEDGHQLALMAQAALHRSQYPQLKWLHAIPNGGSRHFVEAQKLVGTGTRKGIFDLFLPYPAKGYHEEDDYHGLYIEMKTPGRKNAKSGGLTEEQIEFMTYAVVAGYKCSVCYSWEEAWQAILSYLNGE